MSIIVGFTGSRYGLTAAQSVTVKKLLQRLRPSMVVHGGCVGADAMFDEMAREMDLARRIYPADNVPRRLRMTSEVLEQGTYEVMEASPAPGRNRYIIEDATVMIGCPNSDHAPADLRGQGTWTTIKWARDAARALYLVVPTGVYMEERMIFLNMLLKTRDRARKRLNEQLPLKPRPLSSDCRRTE